MQGRVAPERVKIPGKYRVAAGLVDVQNDPGELGTGFPQFLNERRGLAAKTAGRHQAEHRIPCVDSLTAKNVPQCAPSGLLVISGQPPAV